MVIALQALFFLRMYQKHKERVSNMNPHLIEILSINYVDFLLALGTIIVGSVVIKEAIEKFCDAFGIEFKWIRKKREKEKLCANVQAEVKLLSERLELLRNMRDADLQRGDQLENGIAKALEEIRKDIIELRETMTHNEAVKRFKVLRREILTFANDLPHKESVSAELIRQVYKEINEYEELSKNHNFKNNQVNASIAVIQEKYMEMLAKGLIIEED